MTVSEISRKFSRTCRRAAHLCIKRGKFSRKSHWNDTGARLASSWQPTGLSEPHKAVLSEEPFNLLLNFDSQQLETGEVFFLGGQRYIEMAKNATSCLVQWQKGQGQGHGDSLHPWSTSQLLVVTPLNDDRLAKISKFYIPRTHKKKNPETK